MEFSRSTPGTGTFRVDRGGARSDYAANLRSAIRQFSGIDTRSGILGFRLVRTAP